jgi:hypothetical protein
MLDFPYSWRRILTIREDMQPWAEDFSTFTWKEVLARLAENRAWSKELRLKASALVNTRLAKTISQADYVASRKRALEDEVECRRRALLLESHIHRYESGPVSREAQ